MLRKLIQAAISISIVLSLLAIAAILIGHDQSEPELFKYLNICDGQPCYLSIVPGKNTWNDTIATFEDTPGMQFDPDINIASNPPGFQGNALILLATAQDETIMDEIDLRIRSSSVTVGNLVDRFGSPCAVIFTGQLRIIYPGMSVLIFSDQFDADQVLKPSAPAYEINLFNRIKSCDQVSGAPFQFWKGFTRYTN